MSGKGRKPGAERWIQNSLLSITAVKIVKRGLPQR
jgi:hypothetical protein